MSSGFITEAEIEEHRRVRQTEWEKVRKPDEPLEAPEEDYDRRTLFERLEEQRQKKDLEYEESHKLKNMIKGLEDDEIEFLDMVDRTKMEIEKRVQVEEAKELQQYRSKVAALREQQSLNKELEDKETPVFSSLNEPFSSGTMPQNKVLASIVKKRAASEKLPNSPPKKIAAEGSNSVNSDPCDSVLSKSKLEAEPDSNKCDEDSERLSRHGVMKETMVYPSAMKCVGVLPGIGSYISDDSSDSDNTSGSELEDNYNYNIRGQKVQKKVRSA